MRKLLFSALSALILIGLLTFVFNVKPVKSEWTGTVYIRADGSVDPPDAPIITYNNITYTLTGNITSSGYGIVVERDNIVIDGAGYTLQGTGSGTGIDLSGRTHVTVRDTQIENFYYGIYLNSSSINSLSGNNIANNTIGVFLDYSSNYNSIIGNTFTNSGLVVVDSYMNVVEDNTVNGKPLVYLEGVADYSVGDAGQVILVNCSRIRVENLNLSYTSVGVQLWKTNNSVISGNNIANNSYGVLLEFSSYYNSVSGNNIIGNNIYGVLLDSFSTYSSISRNNLINNGYGIMLYFSSNNSISGNNIANNIYGVWLGYSINWFYHNNFIDNNVQVFNYENSSRNLWDVGYPSGGNYWSDHKSADVKNGQYQNVTGSDGVADASYQIDENNIDKYPLMARITTFDAGVWNGKTYNIKVVSNSTLSGFKLDVTQKTISFNVTGIEGTAAFCRIIIPNIIVHDLWHGNYTVLLNGEPQPFINWTDSENTYIYINYTHSEHQITIIPECPSSLILPLLIVIATLAAVSTKMKIAKNKKSKPLTLLFDNTIY